MIGGLFADVLAIGRVRRRMRRDRGQLDPVIALVFELVQQFVHADRLLGERAANEGPGTERQSHVYPTINKGEWGRVCAPWMGHPKNARISKRDRESKIVEISVACATGRQFNLLSLFVLTVRFVRQFVMDPELDPQMGP